MRWKAAAGDGREHLVLNSTSGGTSANGVVIGNSRGIAFGLCCAIDADTDWSALKLLADGHGHWRTLGGKTLLTLAGCVDAHVIIGSSPGASYVLPRASGH